MLNAPGECNQQNTDYEKSYRINNSFVSSITKTGREGKGDSIGLKQNKIIKLK